MSATYRYEARGPSGRIERGALDAANATDALERLRRRNLTPLELKPAQAAGDISRLTDIAARDLSRTLAQLLRAGLSFAQALRFAGEELAPLPAAAASRMREAAERGEPASSALEDFTGPEALLLKGVIRAGETSGKLVDALEVAAISFARAADMRARLATALIYPCFVIFATLATLASFLLFVVPTLGQAFAGAEDRLPASTRALMQFSYWLKANGVITLLGLVALGGIAFTSSAIRASITAALDGLLVSPLGLGIAQRLDISSFASLAALSLMTGVSAAPAFEAAASAVRNQHIRARLQRAIAAIRVGERPSQAFEQYAQPPRSFLRLAHVGEETGKLGETLKQASALLSSEAEQRLERLGAVAGPIVTLALGGLVAGVVMSLFLGLLAMSDMATA